MDNDWYASHLFRNGKDAFELTQEAFSAHLLVELFYAARDFLRFHPLHSLHKDFCRGFISGTSKNSSGLRTHQLASWFVGQERSSTRLASVKLFRGVS
jgi:hypothetical protein